MNPLILGPLFEMGKTLLDRFVPDPEKKREAEAEFLRMAAEGELKQVIAQLEINAREATHASVFVAGWRPAFGW
jgi:sensor domain CHASE-containing protein